MEGMHFTCLKKINNKVIYLYEEKSCFCSINNFFGLRLGKKMLFIYSDQKKEKMRIIMKSLHLPILIYII